jgi:uncharacterized membrane protein
MHRRLNRWFHRLIAGPEPVMRVCLGGILYMFSAAAISGELHELSVSEMDGAYSLSISAVLDAPADDVFQIVSDYRHADRINPAITSIDIVPLERAGVTRVKGRLVEHVGPFSFELEWGADVVESKRRVIEIETIPELSSFESGFARWELRSRGEQTWVHLESTLKPKFFVPPVIGDYLIKRCIEREALDTFQRIECYAQAMPEIDTGKKAELLEVSLDQHSDCDGIDGYETGWLSENR